MFHLLRYVHNSSMMAMLYTVINRSNWQSLDHSRLQLSLQDFYGLIHVCADTSRSPLSSHVRTRPGQ